MNDGPEREPAEERSAIRLFVEAALEAGAPVALDAAQVHYLRNVMRQSQGDRIRLFNGRDGEWEGTIETLAPKRAGIRIEGLRAAQTPAPELWLLFAPLKAERTRFTVEKATELGVGALHPVLTRRGRTQRVNTARLQACAIEAAEQCGRLDVPQVAAPRPLADALAAWPPERRLLVCDPEAERPAADALAAAAGGSGAPWAVLVGPEGGFTPEEKRLLRDHTTAVPARLGPRILRAETAAAAALACLQALAGDWR